MTKSDKGINRREVLQAGAVVGAGALLSQVKTAEAATPKVPRRTLGKTKKKVPILVFGGAVSLDPRFDRKLAKAVDYGIDYFDAARVYGGGTCEAAIGSYLSRAKNRNKIWLTSKSPDHDVPGFKRQLQKTLRDLRTSWVDLYFMHALKNKRYINAQMGKAAYQLKKQGKIKHVGFSCHDGNVDELLMEASKHSWVDVIMFRYNFRTYGNKKLNKAIDACAKANIGLIAMKTQGSAASFASEWQKFKKTGKWTKHQAVLKAVWADKRIHSVVSHMDTMTKLKQNVAAAVNRTKLTSVEHNELHRYAAATRSHACDGCDHLCGARVEHPVQIADTMRFLMYHDVYGETAKARQLYRRLPVVARKYDGVDFTGANAACPNGVDVAALMQRARTVLG